MEYEVKITKLDNRFLLKVIDLSSDRRAPIKKLVATDTQEIEILLDNIYNQPNHETNQPIH